MEKLVGRRDGVSVIAGTLTTNPSPIKFINGGIYKTFYLGRTTDGERATGGEKGYK